VTGRVIASGSAFVANSATTYPRLSQHMLPEEVHAYASVPVRTVTTTAGALVVTKAIPFIKYELTALEAVGELAAIALQRQQLHEQVERKAIDLEAAYESTIAGWARALDMRDRITKGHTQRGDGDGAATGEGARRGARADAASSARRDAVTTSARWPFLMRSCRSPAR
jgi:GAF domain-containing protein